MKNYINPIQGQGGMLMQVKTGSIQGVEDAEVKNSLKTCPKCGGSCFLSNDLYGCFWNCINCGFVRNISCPQCHRRYNCKVVR